MAGGSEPGDAANAAPPRGAISRPRSFALHRQRRAPRKVSRAPYLAGPLLVRRPAATQPADVAWSRAGESGAKSGGAASGGSSQAPVLCLARPQRAMRHAALRRSSPRHDAGASAQKAAATEQRTPHTVAALQQRTALARRPTSAQQPAGSGSHHRHSKQRSSSPAQTEVPQHAWIKHAYGHAGTVASPCGPSRADRTLQRASAQPGQANDLVGARRGRSEARTRRA